MALGETILLVGVALAVWGAISVLLDALVGDGNRWFVGYLVGLLLGLAVVGYLLLTRT
ncbi:hypothetical protein [Halolamina rubra]|uniref:hypothetical protein n=1 Tax=Halolamina rubra TaxID=1380430 RepID=UPI0012ABBAFE|nr:hypothetical protein [Halolamina rubra]